MRHAKWRGSTFTISIALKRVFEDAAAADEEAVTRSDEVSRRSLVSASRCVRACMRIRRYARVLRILLQLRSQTAVPPLGDQFGLLGVTKVLREDRQTRMGLRGRTLRAREINERSSLRRNGMPTARTRLCQDTSGYYPRTYRWYVALVSSRREAHPSILNFASGSLNL